MCLLTYHHIILSCILSQLQSGANDARSDDTCRLKVSVAEWLNGRNSAEMQARLSAKKKSERGICNDVTGRLICPIDFDWDDLEYVTCGAFRRYGLIVLFSVRAKLRNAAPGYDFSSSFFLRCLYEEEGGDPTCPEEGFLKGPLLLRVSFSPLGSMCI